MRSWFLAACVAMALITPMARSVWAKSRMTAQFQEMAPIMDDSMMFEEMDIDFDAPTICG
jgi:hypothetical protein